MCVCVQVCVCVCYKCMRQKTAGESFSLGLCDRASPVHFVCVFKYLCVSVCVQEASFRPLAGGEC